jgi:hypothetical protein
MWHIYQPYADPQFLAEFPIRFHQRWFEMYLTVSLMDERRRPAHITSWTRRARRRERPPRLDRSRVRHGWSARAARFSPLPDTRNRELGAWDRIALRVRASVDEKKGKFDTYLRDGLVTPDDALVKGARRSRRHRQEAARL